MLNYKKVELIGHKKVIACGKNEKNYIFVKVEKKLKYLCRNTSY